MLNLKRGCLGDVGKGADCLGRVSLSSSMLAGHHDPGSSPKLWNGIHSDLIQSP